MKQFKKTILAGALMVVAGGAHANLATQLSTNTATSGSNEAFLVAFDAAYVNSDSSLGRTFNLDLGTTFGALLASPSTALATISALFPQANKTIFLAFMILLIPTVIANLGTLLIS